MPAHTPPRRAPRASEPRAQDCELLPGQPGGPADGDQCGRGQRPGHQLRPARADMNQTFTITRMSRTTTSATARHAAGAGDGPGGSTRRGTSPGCGPPTRPVTAVTTSVNISTNSHVTYVERDPGALVPGGPPRKRQRQIDPAADGQQHHRRSISTPLGSSVRTGTCRASRSRGGPGPDQRADEAGDDGLGDGRQRNAVQHAAHEREQEDEHHQPDQRHHQSPQRAETRRPGHIPDAGVQAYQRPGEAGRRQHGDDYPDQPEAAGRGAPRRQSDLQRRAGRGAEPEAVGDPLSARCRCRAGAAPRRG